MSTNDPEGAPGAVTELQAAHDELARLRAAPDLDDEALDRVADAYESFEDVLDRWEERATDWDDFQGYVEFRNDVAATLESIPEDIPESEAFLAADGHVKTGSATQSLRQRDFDAAREALAPAREYADHREALAEARERYREARRAVRRRRDEVADSVDDLERLVELSEVELEAPVEELRDPIERYDGAVEAAFAAFRRTAPARDVLAFVETASAYPLVDVQPPPAELLEYVREQPAGEHALPELLEYAEYSASKLQHYVDDPDLLKRRVAVNRTYLERLSADPLVVTWPPADRELLRYRTGELVSLVARFADDETVAALRAVRALTFHEDYDRLRTAAVARAELTDEERRRVERGVVDEELATARETRERLEAALEEYPAAP